MKEQGLFRTKVFGGFNKKDVFEYFETLQSQVKDENSDIVEKNKALEEEIEVKNQKISELLDKNDVYSDRVVALENKITELSDENEILKAANERIKLLEASLIEANKALSESEDYKSRFEELSRKILKMKSEMILKDSQMQKKETKYNALKSAVSSMPEIDENLLLSAKNAIDLLSDLLEVTNKTAEFSKLLKTED